MKTPNASELFRRADDIELQLCRQAIQWSRHHGLEPFFRGVSRLGDGAFWYGVIAVVLLLEGTSAALLTTIAGLASTIIYKLLKGWLVRERPYITHSGIECAAKVLDRYSFPSGHTLHAVCFTVLLTYINPILGLIVLPFTLCVALSRVVLGLHYPSDVGAGSVIGILIASTAITFMPFEL
ncbi:phosphatase PAP2 family protein [Hahella sp. CCB-MM4]|uniref:phosphatase PAP2 family protein n=1 Tax=Hahella sp. (strain CCB-MM4) TaxID=1926491 RepID=UPI000B9BCEDE|nr:phosphatase PAP2 family protein [Hahella sp. CCB-MM4]OZG70666.1 phosphatase PAP2 family protein [Hahella sp. CCB-MM4]